MISNLSILKNLVRIDRLYQKPGPQIEALMHAKLGVLELCGWVEETMDKIVIDASQRSLASQSHRDYIENSVVKTTYGFQYEAHFRRMLIGVIGLKGVQDMESKVDRALFDPMCGALTTMKPNRNSYSHTYLKGATIAIDAPSVSIQHCLVIYAGLKNIDNVLRIICQP
jgi:hypothetical protein